MLRHSLLALALVFTASVGARPDDDKDVLKGSWTVVKSESNGKPHEETLKARFTFKDGDKLLFKLVEEEAQPAIYKLDATKKPKQIDITVMIDNKSDTALGIYELDGDKMRLCIAEPDAKGGRPTEFKSTDDKVVYLELTRDKK
jgi:uncharacterized protein (TIGR03067 family)